MDEANLLLSDYLGSMGIGAYWCLLQKLIALSGAMFPLSPQI